MLSYLFILGFFKNVLSFSHAIAGRIFYSNNTGLEINSDELGEVMKDIVDITDKKNFPCVIMLPPVSTGTFTGNQGDWENYRITLMFLKTSYINSDNQTINKNKNTGKSMHTISEDWHDMKRIAMMFLKTVSKVMINKRLYSYVNFTKDLKVFTPISLVGKNRLSGVRLEFGLAIFTDCKVDEDYDENIINSISVTLEDTHPEHKL